MKLRVSFCLLSIPLVLLGCGGAGNLPIVQFSLPTTNPNGFTIVDTVAGTTVYDLMPTGLDRGGIRSMSSGGFVGQGMVSGNTHAIFFSTSGGFTDLSSAFGSASSYCMANAISGTQFVANTSGQPSDTADFWFSPGASPVAFAFSGYTSPQIFGMSSEGIVGYAATNNSAKVITPLFWSSATVAPQVIPYGAGIGGQAYAVGEGSSTFIGGSVTQADSTGHATVWPLKAGHSILAGIDLNPAGALDSAVFAVDGSQFGGTFTDSSSVIHPAVWTGASASSVVDLSLAGETSGLVHALSNQYAVGNVTIGGHVHAVLWNIGTKNYLDLQTTLGSGLTSSGAATILSTATGVYVGGSISSTTGTHPAVWFIATSALP